VALSCFQYFQIKWIKGAEKFQHPTTNIQKITKSANKSLHGKLGHKGCLVVGGFLEFRGLVPGICPAELEQITTEGPPDDVRCLPDG